MWLEAGWRASIGKLLPALDRYDIVHVYMTTRVALAMASVLLSSVARYCTYFYDWKR